jgi:hypothetical protein
MFKITTAPRPEYDEEDVKYSNSFYGLLILLIIVVALFLLVVGPFIEIWAVNTLFKSSVEYSWLNWFCVIVLHTTIKI